MGFSSHSYTSPPDGKYGVLENGTWNGIVAQLEEGSVDFTQSLAMSVERTEVIDDCFNVQPVLLTLFTSMAEDSNQTRLDFVAFFLNL